MVGMIGWLTGIDRQNILNVCKKFKFDYNKLLTGRLMAHQHINATSDSA